MRSAAAAAMLATVLAPGWARAGRIEVAGCPFTAAALEDAVARELVNLGRGDASTAAATITCAAGLAQVAVAAEPPVTRTIDLGDVPPALAPRVVAVLLAATLLELETAAPSRDDAPPPPPAPTTTTAPPAPTPPASTPPAPTRPASTPPAPTPPATTPPATITAIDAERPVIPAPPVDRAPAASRRHRPTLLGDRRWRLGASVRGLSRSYRGNPGPLWGAGAAIVVGPLGLGLVHARATFVHPLGELTATVTAVDLALTVACSRADTTACLGARVEVGRGAVTAVATDPTVTGGELGSLDVHGAVEVAIARDVGGVELAGVIAVGAAAGVVARANGVEAARLAGWTLGAALEVRR